MKPFLDKEYHPVIESFVADFVEDEMDPVEKNAFKEVLVHNDDLRELALRAKKGKRLLERMHQLKTMDAFVKRLKKSFPGG